MDDGRRVTRRVCALFDACTAEASPRGRRDAALISVLYGAGVPRSAALALPLDAYDPTSGVLAWSRPAGPGPDTEEHRVARRRAVEGAREALGGWLQVRGGEPGPLLCRLGETGAPTGAPLTSDDVDRILAGRAREVGVRTWSTDAFRRHYDSPWWREAPRSEPDGAAGRAPRDGGCGG